MVDAYDGLAYGLIEGVQVAEFWWQGGASLSLLILPSKLRKHPIHHVLPLHHHHGHHAASLDISELYVASQVSSRIESIHFSYFELYYY